MRLFADRNRGKAAALRVRTGGFRLVIDEQTAKALGLTITNSFLLHPERVVE
jgi:hypothetical protein